jgi:uncharacterized iron-regulated membrane protein
MPPRIYTVRPPTNPLLQALYFLVGVVILIGALFMSAVILVVVLGLAVILGIVIYIRVWWLKRKLARSRGNSAAGPSTRSESEVIEVEYTVINERDEKDD